MTVSNFFYSLNRQVVLCRQFNFLQTQENMKTLHFNQCHTYQMHCHGNVAFKRIHFDCLTNTHLTVSL